MATDAIDAMNIAIVEARHVLGRPIILDCFDSDDEADAWHPLRIVTDNGPCYKSGAFARFIDSRLEIEHVRTRRKSPHTNGVVERFGGSLKYERLFRYDIRDGLELQDHLDSYRWEFNEDRPHGYLEWERPGDVFRAGSLKLVQANRGSLILTRDKRTHGHLSILGTGHYMADALRLSSMGTLWRSHTGPVECNVGPKFLDERRD